jgi:DNA modification methylase
VHSSSVIKLLSVPGDIVMDWTAGDRSLFIAGNHSNRFVIGLEAKLEFCDLARSTFEAVVSKKPPRSDKFGDLAGAYKEFLADESYLKMESNKAKENELANLLATDVEASTSGASTAGALTAGLNE